MRNRSSWILCVSLALAAVWALAGCSPATPVPPTAVPPTAAPPTAVPPTAVPPTAVPPTSAPTTAPTTAAEPAEEVARPSNPGGPGPAVNLTGDPQAGATLYVDKCQVCHGEEGKGGIDNPGSDDGTTPALNPIDSTLVDKEPKTFATNIDLFVEHGSTPAGSNPKDTMPAWGDKRLLTSQQIADVIAYIMSLNPPAPAEEVARPSNPGGPGPAVNLTGDPQAGAKLYVDKCQVCHGEEGKGGIDNPGSDDGTTPALNPIDSTLVDKEPKTFATNIDLFVEHGSTPAGSNPKDTMPAWGDKRLLTSQQIADVIAYIMSLNKP